MAIGKRYKIALGLLAFTLFGWAGCAMAQPGPSKAAPMAKGISNFSWHDGKRTRTVWMRSDMVAEFPKPGTRSLSGDGPPVSGATSLPVRGNLRLWKLPVGVNATTVKNLSLGSRSDSFSPVFQETPGSGRKMALPGDVIVTLDPKWDETKIEIWARGRGVTIKKKMSFGTNIFLLATPPGLVSLELANSIAGEAGVISAQPNWWREVSVR